MGLNRKQVNPVNVGFGTSGIDKVQRFGRSVPQFFNENLEPILAVNQYMRIKSLRLARKSLLTTAEPEFRHKKGGIPVVRVIGGCLTGSGYRCFGSMALSKLAMHEAGDPLAWVSQVAL